MPPGLTGVLMGQSRVILAAAAGGVLFAALGVPAGYMSGAMVAIAALASWRLAEKLTEPMRVLAMVASGSAIGSGMSPQMLQGFGRYPASLAMMAFAVVAITIAGAALLRRMPGFSRETAFFAAVPGALSYVFAVAVTTQADIGRMAVVQVLRLFFLMAILPLVVAESGLAMAAPDISVFDPPWLVLVIFMGAFALGSLLERIGVAGGMLFGAMIISGGLHASGYAPGKLPLMVSITGQILVGAWSGTRFIGFDWRLLGRIFAISLGSFALTMGIAGAFATISSWLLGTPFAASLLAFAPGGLEAMTLLAFALGIDPLFVGAHHLARFVMISLALPVVTRFWLRGNAE